MTMIWKNKQRKLIAKMCNQLGIQDTSQLCSTTFLVQITGTSRNPDNPDRGHSILLRCNRVIVESTNELCLLAETPVKIHVCVDFLGDEEKSRLVDYDGTVYDFQDGDVLKIEGIIYHPEQTEDRRTSLLGDLCTKQEESVNLDEHFTFHPMELDITPILSY